LRSFKQFIEQQLQRKNNQARQQSSATHKLDLFHREVEKVEKNNVVTHTLINTAHKIMKIKPINKNMDNLKNDLISNPVLVETSNQAINDHFQDANSKPKKERPWVYNDQAAMNKKRFEENKKKQTIEQQLASMNVSNLIDLDFQKKKPPPPVSMNSTRRSSYETPLTPTRPLSDLQNLNIEKDFSDLIDNYGKPMQSEDRKSSMSTLNSMHNPVPKPRTQPANQPVPLPRTNWVQFD